jgi:hypothetical protein
MYHGSVKTGPTTGIRLVLAGPLLSAALMLQSCSGEPPKAIIVDARAITVVNHSQESWENVEIWLNDHYRVTRPRMRAGERFGVPLNAFVAGFGQRFVPGRQVVRGVEVTATTAKGQAVRLVFGEGRRR